MVGLVWVTTIVPYLPMISPPPPTFRTMHRPHRLIYEPLLRLRRVCSQLHPSSFTASTYRSVKSFSNFTIIENMQSNGSSKGSSKASGRSVRSFLSRNKKKNADNEDSTPLLSHEEVAVSPPESPVEFASTDNGKYYIPNR